MRIAQVSPLMESVPPQLYGGTERVVHFLSEELVAQGHDLHLFASAESKTSGKLHPVVPMALRLSKSLDRIAPHVMMLEQVLQQSEGFDVIHFHIDHIHLPLVRRIRTPCLSTFHGRLDIPDMVPLYREFSDAPFSSISNSQRKPLSWLNWRATVYHGLPADLFTFNEAPGDYLAFLGRISPEKGVEQAIEIAKRAGRHLKIAAKIGAAYRKYFERNIKPLLEHPLIEYIGEINEEQKNEFLGNAKALLFPIEWPEPFGLVMIEALACGTPVIAFRRGSVPEILDDGKNGYIVEDEPGAVEALGKLDRIERRDCRKSFDDRFLASRMAQDYAQIYQELIADAVTKQAQKNYQSY